ncbi:MAG: adenylate/guanylate cyclase domain-containing protein, partial [Geminicoccaceae bacterium]
ALYGAIGDAAAYHLVREHFAWLAAIIREHEGAIVKTIGDAVMAAFHDPRAGLRAAFAMQARVADFNASGDAAGERPIVLKLGLHEGPSIAVTMNDRLDYFGGTVNLAARLQSQSRGGDVVVSGVLAATEGIAAIAHPLVGRAETASLRGFAQPMDFVRFA